MWNSLKSFCRQLQFPIKKSVLRGGNVMRSFLAMAVVVALAVGGFAIWQTREPVVVDVDIASSVEIASVADSPWEPFQKGEPYYDYFLQCTYLYEDLPFFIREDGYRQIGPLGAYTDLRQEIKRWYRSRNSKYRIGGTTLWGEHLVREWSLGAYSGRPEKIVIVEYTMYAEIDGEIVCTYTDDIAWLAEMAPEFRRVEYDYLSGRLGEERYAEKRRVLSHQEFDKVDRFLRLATDSGLAFIWELIGPLQKDLVIALEKELDTEDLFEPVVTTIDPPLTLADIVGLRQWEKEEYAPDRIFVAPSNSAAAWLTVNTVIPLSDGSKPMRCMLISESTLGYDWIKGVNATIRHEFVHSWQSVPVAWWYNVESWNEFWSNALTIDPLDFIFHPYLRRVNALAERYFNFDSNVALLLMTGFSAGGITEFERTELAEFSKKINDIAVEMQSMVYEMYLEFYSDSLFYTALMDLCYDEDMFIDLMFAQRYIPTCLGATNDPQKSADETRRWQMANESLIKKIGDKALQQCKDNVEDRYAGEEEVEGYRPRSLWAKAIWDRLTPEAQAELIAVYKTGGLKAALWLYSGGDL